MVNIKTFNQMPNLKVIRLREKSELLNTSLKEIGFVYNNDFKLFVKASEMQSPFNITNEQIKNYTEL